MSLLNCSVVVNRTPDTIAYEKDEPALIEKLLKLRSRLIDADLGHGIQTQHWQTLVTK